MHHDSRRRHRRSSSGHLHLCDVSPPLAHAAHSIDQRSSFRLYGICTLQAALYFADRLDDPVFMKALVRLPVCTIETYLSQVECAGLSRVVCFYSVEPFDIADRIYARLLETVHTAFTMYNVYVMTVTNFGNLGAPGLIFWCESTPLPTYSSIAEVSFHVPPSQE